MFRFLLIHYGMYWLHECTQMSSFISLYWGLVGFVMDYFDKDMNLFHFLYTNLFIIKFLVNYEPSYISSK